MPYALKINTAWTEIRGAFTDAEGEFHTANWPECWSPVEIAARGLVEIVESDPPPGIFQSMSDVLVDVAGVPHREWQTEEFDTEELRAVMLPQVYAERDRRLALGFDFDFGDARGVHRIGTTPADMVGWDKVSKLASAAINTGTPDAAITISTDTGFAVITAMEWQQVLLTAGTFEQPIWQASFALAAMSTIPADFADGAFWP